MVEPALRPLADVAFVYDIAHGAPDIDVLELARLQQRILVTEDYDFGALIFGDRRAPPIGVIHLALEGMDKDERDQKFAAEVEHLLDIAPGRFVVFSKNTPRSRPLP
jgi:predicted nuclease of predicted toxin-antitoxin system